VRDIHLALKLMPGFKRTPRCSGFTLIELCVVVLIVVVLAAMVTPSLIRVHSERASQDCVDHLSKVGRAIALYAYDFDDTLPMARYDSSAESGDQSLFCGPRGRPFTAPIWADLVRSYVPSMDTFTCPSDIFHEPSPDTHAGLPISFAMNAYFYSQPGVNRETLSGGSLGEIGNVSVKILLTESAAEIGGSLMRPDLWKAIDGSSIWERHLGGANWLYGDLHVEHHPMPKGWKTTPQAAWLDPKKAVLQPFPQWFPWVKTHGQSW